MKKLRLVLAALIVGISLIASSEVAAPVTASTPPTDDVEVHLQGDVTCNLAVDIADGLDLLRGIAGLETTDSFCLSDAGDTDCDNDIDTLDALRVFSYAGALSPVGAASDGCSAIGAQLVHPPTSETLIADALAAGDITYEESLLYRAYALYDVPELPPEYHSETIDYHAALELFTEVLENEDTLSAGLLEALEPFRVRPADPASIFNNPPGVTAAAAGDWHSSLAAGGKVRVWVKEAPNWEADLATYAADVTKVWTPLGSIFRYPIPDTPGAANVNPDSATDVYFVDVGTVDPRKDGCSASPTPPNCTLSWAGAYTGYTEPYTAQTASAYVMVARGQTGARLTYVLAHELMHAGQHAYDYHEKLWIKDATATWGGFRVLQELGETREELYGMARRLYAELNQPLTRDTGYLDETRYRRWLYFFFASMNMGDGIVKSIWQEAAAVGVQNEKAVDNAYSFDSHFADFTVRNWNSEPVDPLYWDPARGDADFPSDLEPPIPASRDQVLAGSQSVDVEVAVAPLSALYYRYTFEENVRTIDFYPVLNGNPHAHIWAIYKADGEWQPPEDWSTDNQSFCRDIPKENISELILVLSNSGMDDDLPGDEKWHIDASEPGCDGYAGWVQTTIRIQGDDTDMTYTTPQVNVRFEVLETGPGYVDYTLVNPSGPVAWHAQGTKGGCQAVGDASVAFPGIPYDPATITPAGYIHVVGQGGGDWHAGIIRAFDPAQTYTVTCPGDPPKVRQDPFAEAGYLWLITSMEPNSHQDEDLVLEGHLVTNPFPGMTQTFDWELRPVGNVPSPDE